MVNNTGSTQRVATTMARKNNTDDVWNEIFDNLVLDNEPPFEYIKNVIITTKSGLRLRVSAIDFAQILERERYINPEDSDIVNCKLTINFNKIRKDVDEWANQTMHYFDSDGKFLPKKPRAKRKPKAKPKVEDVTSPPVKKPRTKTPASPAKKPRTRKSTGTKKS